MLVPHEAREPLYPRPHSSAVTQSTWVACARADKQPAICPGAAVQPCSRHRTRIQRRTPLRNVILTAYCGVAEETSPIIRAARPLRRELCRDSSGVFPSCNPAIFTLTDMRKTLTSKRMAAVAAAVLVAVTGTATADALGVGGGSSTATTTASGISKPAPMFKGGLTKTKIAALVACMSQHGIQATIGSAPGSSGNSGSATAGNSGPGAGTGNSGGGITTGNSGPGPSTGNSGPGAGNSGAGPANPGTAQITLAVPGQTVSFSTSSTVTVAQLQSALKACGPIGFPAPPFAGVKGGLPVPLAMCAAKLKGMKVPFALGRLQTRMRLSRALLSAGPKGGPVALLGKRGPRVMFRINARGAKAQLVPPGVALVRAKLMSRLSGEGQVRIVTLIGKRGGRLIASADAKQFAACGGLPVPPPPGALSATGSSSSTSTSSTTTSAQEARLPSHCRVWFVGQPRCGGRDAAPAPTRRTRPCSKGPTAERVLPRRAWWNQAARRNAEPGHLLLTG